MKCGRKTIYRTRKKAIRAMNGIRDNNKIACGYPVRVYKCLVCNGYHLTSISQHPL